MTKQKSVELGGNCQENEKFNNSILILNESIVEEI